jgi:hypothetical protein
MNTVSIITVFFYYLRYEAIYHYLCLYRDLLVVYPEVKAIIDVDFDVFIELLRKELKLLDALHGSELSKAIALRLKVLGKIESKPYEEESAAVKVLSNEYTVAEIIIAGKGRFKGEKVVTFLTGFQDFQD